MRLCLLALLDGTAARLPFAYHTDAAGCCDDVEHGEIEAAGEVVNHSGYMVLTGAIRLNASARCARCGETFDLELEFPLEAKLAERLDGADTDEFILLEDGCLDLAELVRTQVLLELPTRFLCRPDCMGLCPKCGKNLNTGRCGCPERGTRVWRRFSIILTNKKYR